MIQGLFGKERYITYGLYSLYDVAGEIKKAEEAMGREPKLPAIDETMGRYIKAYQELAPLITKAVLTRVLPMRRSRCSTSMPSASISWIANCYWPSLKNLVEARSAWTTSPLPSAKPVTPLKTCSSPT